MEIEMNDTVTTIERNERIGVVACILEVALYRHVVLVLEVMLVELYRITVADCILDDFFIPLLVVNDEVVEVIVELV